MIKKSYQRNTQGCTANRSDLMWTQRSLSREEHEPDQRAETLHGASGKEKPEELKQPQLALMSTHSGTHWLH